MTFCPDAIAACADITRPVQQREALRCLWIGRARMPCTGGARRDAGRLVVCNDDALDSRFGRDSVGLDRVRELVPEATAALAFRWVLPAYGLSGAIFGAVDAGPDGAARTRESCGCPREPGFASGARPLPAGCFRHIGARWPRGHRSTLTRPVGTRPLRPMAVCPCSVPREHLDARDRPAEASRTGFRAAEQSSHDLRTPGLVESSGILSEPRRNLLRGPISSLRCSVYASVGPCRSTPSTSDDGSSDESTVAVAQSSSDRHR